MARRQHVCDGISDLLLDGTKLRRPTVSGTYGGRAIVPGMVATCGCGRTWVADEAPRPSWAKPLIGWRPEGRIERWRRERRVRRGR